MKWKKVLLSGLLVFSVGLSGCSESADTASESISVEETVVSSTKSSAEKEKSEKLEQQETEKREKITQEKEITEETAKEQENLEVIDTSAYDTIIEDYILFIENFLSNKTLSQNNEINRTAVLVTQEPSQNNGLYYTFFDIDTNEIPELVISFGKGNNILDIYTLSPENIPIRLTTEENGLDQIGEKQSLTILKDGTLSFYGRGGANIHANSLFSFNSEGLGLSKIKESTGSIDDLHLEELADPIELTSLEWQPIPIDYNSSSQETE